jgi:hypothetical protein
MIFGLFVFGLFAGLVAACQVGFWIGRRTASSQDPVTISHTVSWQGAVLALAGLLIGFTFAMAMARYETRREIILAEANAIGTTYLRTRLLEGAAGEELRTLVGRYVDARIAVFDAGTDWARVEERERTSAGLEQQIWSRVEAAGRADPRSVMAGLLVQSTNEMFDLAGTRRAARGNPVPPTVFVVLILVAAVGMASIGYTCGLAGKRLSFGMIVMPLLVAGVIVLVFDIGNPRRGIVRVSDQTMIRLRQSL